MTELPYRPEQVHDAMASTADLTAEELGALTRIRWALWRSGGYLPDDQRKLARISRVGPRWGRIREVIMAMLTVAGGKISCPEILGQFQAARERREKAVKAAMVRHAPQNRVSYSSNPLKSLSPVSSQASPAHVLARSNQNQNKNLESKSLSAGVCAASGLAKEGSRVYIVGEAALIDRVGLRALAARSQVAKWIAACGNEEELTSILSAAVRENLMGHQFVAVVDQRVGLIKRTRERGPPLPLGPNLVRTRV